MTNPNVDPVTVDCMTAYCPMRVETTALAAASRGGVYCEDCRRDAQQRYDRVSYARDVVRSRERKRRNWARAALRRKGLV